MGTYTANYNLFLPTIGEQGWGDLVNGNFSTIDATMAGLNTRVGTLDTEINAVEEKVTALEPLLAIQVDENQNVTFPGSVTITDEIILNKTVTVSASTMKIGHPNYAGMEVIPICPQILGMLYTGYIRVVATSISSYAESTAYLYLLSSGGWTKTTIKPTNANVDVDYTFTNVKCVMFQYASTGSTLYYYLPLLA